MMSNYFDFFVKFDTILMVLSTFFFENGALKTLPKILKSGTQKPKPYSIKSASQNPKAQTLNPKIGVSNA